MHSIVANGICKTYLQKKEKIAALKEVDIAVKKSSLFGLIGPDGAGKTSFIRILVSLLVADKGEAFVEGLDVVKDLRMIRQKIGYMPGRFSLYQDLSVRENLEFFASVFNADIQSNYYLIKDIFKHLEPFQTRKAGQLSGGMKQKLALSCALIHKPSVLFLDEPTTGVDAVSRKEFWNMLKNLQKYGMTILVSTPYMDEATLCDEIALIQSGRIHQVDTPENIIRQFPEQLFAFKADHMYRMMVALKNHPEVHSCFAFGDTCHVVFKKLTNVRSVAHSLNLGGYGHVRYEEITPNIEDCFIQLMHAK